MQVCKVYNIVHVVIYPFKKLVSLDNSELDFIKCFLLGNDIRWVPVPNENNIYYNLKGICATQVVSTYIIFILMLCPRRHAMYNVGENYYRTLLSPFLFSQINSNQIFSRRYAWNDSILYIFTCLHLNYLLSLNFSLGSYMSFYMFVWCATQLLHISFFLFVPYMHLNVMYCRNLKYIHIYNLLEPLTYKGWNLRDFFTYILIHVHIFYFLPIPSSI